MKGTSTFNAELKFWRPLSGIRVLPGFNNRLVSSHPFLSSDETVSLCILSRAPYGPICTDQIIGVASYLLEEKLRPFFLIKARWVGGEGWNGGEPEPHPMYTRLHMI